MHKRTILRIILVHTHGIENLDFTAYNFSPMMLRSGTKMDSRLCESASRLEHYKLGYGVNKYSGVSLNSELRFEHRSGTCWLGLVLVCGFKPHEHIFTSSFKMLAINSCLWDDGRSSPWLVIIDPRFFILLKWSIWSKSCESEIQIRNLWWLILQELSLQGNYTILFTSSLLPPFIKDFVIDSVASSRWKTFTDTNFQHICD